MSYEDFDDDFKPRKGPPPVLWVVVVLLLLGMAVIIGMSACSAVPLHSADAGQMDGPACGPWEIPGCSESTRFKAFVLSDGSYLVCVPVESGYRWENVPKGGI